MIGDHDRFIDALWSSKFQVTLATFRGKPSQRSRRTSGHKGARIGNPKSDNHKVFYKGVNEKTGTEVHLRGRQLQRIKETAKERYQTEKKSNPQAKLWDVTVDEARWHAAYSLMKSLREAGIDMTTYFKGVSSISWEKPIYQDDLEVLDKEQEAEYIKGAFKKLPRQLGFETQEGGHNGLVEHQQARR